MPSAASSGGAPLEQAKARLVPLRQLEREYIGWVVGQCGGNKTRAAEILGISLKTLHNKLNRLGLRKGAPS
jgi:two-component system response regulator HydG